MLSLSHRFLFIHVPKTGGNSIQDALRAWSDDEIVCEAPHQDGVERFQVRSRRYATKKHSTLAEYRREYGDALMAGLFTFCGVRNPWDRCVSHFLSPGRGQSGWNRDRFVHFVATEVMPLRHYAPDVDCVLRFEHLDTDFAAVCERLSLPALALPRRNASSRGPYQDYYDAETIGLVADRFAEEIARFGYRFEPDRDV